MKRVLLFLCVLMMSVYTFSNQSEKSKIIFLKGQNGIISPNSVSVTINSSNTLRTTFYKEMSPVAITVKNKNGDVVARKVVDAKEFDTVTIEVPYGKEGDYLIEISSHEGVLEGKF